MLFENNYLELLGGIILIWLISNDDTIIEY
jgi:hypothetical protein